MSGTSALTVAATGQRAFAARAFSISAKFTPSDEASSLHTSSGKEESPVLPNTAASFANISALRSAQRLDARRRQCRPFFRQNLRPFQWIPPASRQATLLPPFASSQVALIKLPESCDDGYLCLYFSLPGQVYIFRVRQKPRSANIA